MKSKFVRRPSVKNPLGAGCLPEFPNQEIASQKVFRVHIFFLYWSSLHDVLYFTRNGYNGRHHTCTTRSRVANLPNKCLVMPSDFPGCENALYFFYPHSEIIYLPKAVMAIRYIIFNIVKIHEGTV